MYRVNAFSYRASGGNVAAVVNCLTGTEPSAADMQRLAGKIGYSETCFIFHSEQADFQFRYFTPSEEVALCGHATIGSFAVLDYLGVTTDSHYRIATAAGPIEIIRSADGFYFMSQPAATFGQCLDDPAIARSLGISEAMLDTSLPIQRVSTGLWDILIPLKELATLASLKPNFTEIERLSQLYNVIGYHVFAPGQGQFIASTRNFAPRVAIDEEAATGTSNGALLSYLFHHKKLTNYNHTYLIKQGEVMQASSQIAVKLNGNARTEQTVLYVGGQTSQPIVLKID